MKETISSCLALREFLLSDYFAGDDLKSEGHS
jgi:hypothetical protein